MKQTVSYFARSRLLCTLDRSVLVRLAEEGRVEVFGAGEVVVGVGDRGGRMYVVEGGGLVVECGL